MLISVSYLTPKETIEKTILEIESTSADYLHVDLMDGEFVPKCNFQMESIISLLKEVKKPLDVHFMTFNLEEYINKISILKPSFITFQFEAASNIPKMISLIKKNGSKVGISLKPETSITNLIPYLSELDLILVMSVNPGMGGQKFLESTLDKLNKLKELQALYHYIISVDGGINELNIDSIKKTNIEMIVSGSYITLADDFETQIQKLK